MGGGGAHILGSPMLFVPFTVPTFPATHHQTTHPAHQSHHQQLQANTQNPVQQPQQLTQLNQLSHLNHQGIVPATTNQPTVHSTSCSPQQQATTPNKVKDCSIASYDYVQKAFYKSIETSQCLGNTFYKLRDMANIIIILFC